MGAGSTPAGWYPDVERARGERYWNGSSWTDDRRPAFDSAVASRPSSVPAGYAAYGAQAPVFPGNGLAGWGLGFSISGLVCCLLGFLCVPGVVMGSVHLQRIRRGERDPGSRGLALAAIIVGAIGLLVVLVVVTYVTAIGFALSS